MVWRWMPIPDEEDDNVDIRFEGEWIEQTAKNIGSTAKQFFEGEITQLKNLVEMATALCNKDSKIAYITDKLLPDILKENDKEKILIFTEYKATQEHLAEAIRAKYGSDSVSIINGGKTYEERESEIEHFESKGQFLISTEAGGEGVNLQRKCHIMINFDLPWNPMRLVQRIGRLYRYGQQKIVVVFNIHAPQTLDSYILQVLYERIDQVVKDMAGVSGEFKDGMESEILGELSELLDVSEVLNNATDQSPQRTQEQINEALKKAKEAAEKQRELFEYAAGFNANEFEKEFKIGKEHVKAFVQGMCNIAGVELNKTNDNNIWELRFPIEVASELNLTKHLYKVCFDRLIAVAKREVEMIDFSSTLFRKFIELAKSYGFDGIVAAVNHKDSYAIATAILRWQNDHGKRMRQEFAGIIVHKDHSISLNSSELADWLLSNQQCVEIEKDRDLGKKIYSSTINAIDKRLEGISNKHLHPQSSEVVAMAWCK